MDPLDAKERERWMALAIEQAEQAAALGEVPVGAVVVQGGMVIAKAHNQRESLQDPTAHAELLALRQAASHVGSWRLCGASLYVTLEPCPMCAGAMVNARLAELVYGCEDPKGGAVRSLYQLCGDPRLNHRVNVTSGVRADACGRILAEFFAALRAGRGRPKPLPGG